MKDSEIEHIGGLIYDSENPKGEVHFPNHTDKDIWVKGWVRGARHSIETMESVAKSQGRMIPFEEVIGLCRDAYHNGDKWRLWLDKIAIGMGEGKTADEVYKDYSIESWIEKNL